MGGLRERSIIILNLIASLGRQYSTMRNTRGVGRGLINLTAPTVEKRNEIRGMTNGEVAKELYDVQKKKNRNVWCLSMIYGQLRRGID